MNDETIMEKINKIERMAKELQGQARELQVDIEATIKKQFGILNGTEK